MNAQQFKLLMTQVSRFNNLSTAIDSAKHCSKIQAVLHGDDGTFWRTTPSVARKLEKAGYEIVAYAH